MDEVICDIVGQRVCDRNMRFRQPFHRGWKQRFQFVQITVSILSPDISARISNPTSPLLSSLFDNVPLFNRSRRWTRHTAFTTWVVRFIRIYSPVRSPWSYASKDPALLERRTLCNYKKVRPPFALAPSVPPFPHLVLSFFLPSFPFLSLLLSPSFSFSLSLSFFHDEERAGRAIARGWKTVRCRAAEATEGTGGN